MPQPDKTAAPPPVTPSTFRNRLRLIPSLMSRSALVPFQLLAPRRFAPLRWSTSRESALARSAKHVGTALVVTDRTVLAHLALRMAVDAPAHAERGHLGDLGHRLHLPMARRARVGPQRLDVPHVGEPHEPGERVDADPFGRVALAPGRAHFLDLGLVRRRRAADDLVAADASLQRRDPRLARDRHRVMAVQAGDLVLPGMNVVSEENRLAGTGERSRVFDVGSDGPRG